MNSVRIPLLKSLAREIDVPSPEILDVGCGGGYLAEVILLFEFSLVLSFHLPTFYHVTPD